MNNTDIADKRVHYFDIAKGIGMLSVIAGHMSLSHVNAFVFTYHMPLFFLISGWFFNDKPGKIKKNAIHLLVPYAITVVVIGMVKALKGMINGVPLGLSGGGYLLQVILKTILSGLYGSGSRTDTIFGVEIPAIGAIWFLLALFWSIILLKAIIKIDRLLIRTVVVILCFGLGIASTKLVWLPFSIQPALCALLFLYIGFEFKQRWNGNFVKGNKWTILVCAATWFIALASSYKNTNMSMVRCAFPNGLIDVLGAVAAGWLIIRLSIGIEKMTLLSKPLEFFGKNSLIVLCVHLVELSCFPWAIIYNAISNRTAALVLVYICKLLLNVVATVLIKKGSAFVGSFLKKRTMSGSDREPV